MKQKSGWLIFLLLIVMLLQACSPRQIPPEILIPPEEPSAKTGEVFVLTPGEALVIDGGPMLVGVEQVLEDSRCPANAVCVRAGSVKVQVRVDQKPYTLTLGDLLEGDRNLVGLENCQTLRLVDVQPYPILEDSNSTPEVYLVVEGYLCD